jgi:UDP-N-acetylmuramoyl-tripeptide--D-alanyl-D-alanine ligase
VVAVGQAARAIHQGAQDAAAGGGAAVSQWVPDADAALELVLSDVRPGDVVLVKASRSVGLERLAEALAEAIPSVLAGRAPAESSTGQENA